MRRLVHGESVLRFLRIAEITAEAGLDDSRPTSEDTFESSPRKARSRCRIRAEQVEKTSSEAPRSPHDGGDLVDFGEARLEGCRAASGRHPGGLASHELQRTRLLATVSEKNRESGFAISAGAAEPLQVVLHRRGVLPVDRAGSVDIPCIFPVDRGIRCGGGFAIGSLLRHVVRGGRDFSREARSRPPRFRGGSALVVLAKPNRRLSILSPKGAAARIVL